MDDLTEGICNLLRTFDGEESLKRLFWQLLSYDRVREQLPKRLLSRSVLDLVSTFEIFAASDSLTVVHVATEQLPAGWQLELIAAAARRQFFACVVVLQYETGWYLLYPDETTNPRIRLLPLPGPADRIPQTALALLSLNSTDESGEKLSSLEQSELLDAFFPGVTPNLTDVINEFERIAKHRDQEVRTLRPFLCELSAYPLLTPAQERGEDIWRDGIPTEEQLRFHQERLVLHNLRLVVWMAFKVNRMGITLGDLVQEGVIGLITASRRFDLSRGHRFTTYAFYWIRQAMYRALHNQCNLIRWPVWIAPKLIASARTGNFNALGAGHKPVVFLNRPLTMASLPRCDLVQSQAITESQTGVRNIIAELTPRQRDVISRRFGIDCDEQTLEEIGQQYALTRERIRQIEEKALNKLRHRGRKQRLAPYSECSEWRLTRRLDGSGGTVIRFKSGGYAKLTTETLDVPEPRQKDEKQIFVGGKMQTIRVLESLEETSTLATGELEDAHVRVDANGDWLDDLEPTNDKETKETRHLPEFV